MIGRILAKIFGSKNDRMIKQYRRAVRAINEFEATIEPLSDSELAAKTVEFREMPYLEVPKRRARWLTLTSVKLMPMPLAMAGMKRCISP